MLLLQGRCSKDPNQRTVTVTITDVCPECATDHIDMQALTFNKVRAKRFMYFFGALIYSLL